MASGGRVCRAKCPGDLHYIMRIPNDQQAHFDPGYPVCVNLGVGNEAHLPGSFSSIYSSWRLVRAHGHPRIAAPFYIPNGGRTWTHTTPVPVRQRLCLVFSQRDVCPSGACCAGRRGPTEIFGVYVSSLDYYWLNVTAS
jgi:hypothetical protein